MKNKNVLTIVMFQMCLLCFFVVQKEEILNNTRKLK